MNHQPNQLNFHLPEWLADYARTWNANCDVNTRMRFVIDAAEQNVQRKTGGPFAAAIFESDSGELVSLGVNLVTTHNNAILHAEVVTIMLAQHQLHSFDLGSAQLPRHELLSSSEPCAMCIGAINWSGVHALAYGAAIADAQAIGFDEGPISPVWKQEFSARGIEVHPELERARAVKVLQSYRDAGGVVYNGRGKA